MKTSTDRIPDADALRGEAQAWLRRLESGGATQWDAQAFRRWCDASPAHRAAFDEARRQWRLMKPAIGGLLEADPAAAAFHRRTLQGARSGRRAFLGAAAGTLAVAGVAGAMVVRPPFGLWPSAGEWQADYRTATGEQRAVVLAGRVNVMLNTQTSIRRDLRDGETVGMDLIAGEAAIDLPPPGRSFSVGAGAGRSLAEAGRFEVRYVGDRVCVTCLEGSVRVEHPAGSRVLQARQQTVYDAHALSGVAAVEAADVSAWRRGVLVFRQAPLADVVNEINRYRPGRVVLMAKASGDSAVSGRFAIDALDAALLQIQHSFDLRARSLPGGLLILS